MPRLRPTEVRAVAALLNDPADDVETLAEDVIRKLDELRAKRDVWVVLVRYPDSGIPGVFGPYDTENQANRAMGRDIVAYKEGTWGLPFKLRTPTTGT